MKIKAKSKTYRDYSKGGYKKIKKNLQKSFRRDMKRVCREAAIDAEKYKEVRPDLLSYLWL